MQERNKYPNLETMLLATCVVLSKGRFFDGVPCPKGHIHQRYKKDGSCVECRRYNPDIRKKYYRKNREKLLAKSKLYRGKNPEKWRAIGSNYGKKHPDRRLISKLYSGAKRRGIECTISKEELHAILAPMVCCKTGWKLEFTGYKSTERKNDFAPSFDRIDNSKGYVSGNVQLVCWLYNDLKGARDDAMILDFAKAVAKRGIA